MALPPPVIDATPIIQTVNETTIWLLPEPIAGIIQNLVGAAYVAVGGFVGIFIISAVIRWWQGQKLKQRFEEINQRLTRLERKIDVLVKKKK